MLFPDRGPLGLPESHPTSHTEVPTKPTALPDVDSTFHDTASAPPALPNTSLVNITFIEPSPPASIPLALRTSDINPRDEQADFHAPEDQQVVAADQETNQYAKLVEQYGVDNANLYTSYLNNAYLRETEEKDSIKESLLRGERHIDRDVLAQLHALSQEAQLHPSEFVEGAREEAREFFRNQASEGEHRETYEDLLRRYGITPILYGSLQYNDPYNADIDLALVKRTPTQTSETEEYVIHDLRMKLDKYWTALSPFEGRERGGPNFGSIDYLSQFQNLHELLEKDPEGFALDKVAEIMTGVPLFPKDANIVADMQQQALQIAESDPLITAVTNYVLKDCLRTRERRRGQNSNYASSS